MNALDTLYSSWMDSAPAKKDISNIEIKIDQLLKTISKNEDLKDICCELDNLHGQYSAMVEKEGFTAGFEIARQLFTGGALK